ncbi:hypothetical protein OVA24_15880 [Luteolibacter sp. SL250]|uniref:hypothetical protein n=1 Tax=Luteolibacter sp. SL250 TaxID=2995170 RepID=UPI00227115D3|nr:hypothetical protein [Luteolibacter sp. SL250]WAC18709.1 hypothetical protein OVA24_15880 [Luteolibacter sp. SL250]
MEQPSPAMGKFAFVYRVALARNVKTEAEYTATIHVIPSSTKAFGPADVQLAAYGYGLCIQAIRAMDPEMERMIITPLGEPGLTMFLEPEALVPALRKNGWQVFIEWDL